MRTASASVPTAVRTACLAAVLLFGVVPEVDAQGPPKHEFRGAWIATTFGLDWPPSPSAAPARQKEALRRELDSLKAVGVNAVFFQVRSEGDAFYQSDLEPWSHWLTGEQGTAPDPFYDPLAFAAREAHERGMELHAWFNPFRAVGPNSDHELDSTHVAVEHPSWLLSFSDGLEMLDPGRPAVRDYVTRVILYVARRYEVDGVHFDDYFYPYPPRHMDQDGNRTKDQDTFEAHPRGYEDIENWRRGNINAFVDQVHDSLATVAPDVTFGISPFGIWKSGVPPGISGLSAYHTIYADPVAWLEAQSVDYLAPQLYWGFGGNQDYATLAPWWKERAVAHDRHLYPGLAAYKAVPKAKRTEPRPARLHAVARYGVRTYGPDVVPRQVRFNRRRTGVQGSVFFRSQHLARAEAQGLADSLRQRLYRAPALTPTLPWRNTDAPAAPSALRVDRSGAQVTLQWDPPAEGSPEAARYAVYRVRSGTPPDVASAVQEAENLLAVTGRTTLTDRPVQASNPYHYAVTAVSANSVESAPSAPVAVEGRATPDVEALAVRGNVPNPFADRTSIVLALPEAATVRVTIYDVLGRRVHRTRETLPAGGERRLDLRSAPFSSGVYVYRVTARYDGGGQEAATGRMVRAR